MSAGRVPHTRVNVYVDAFNLYYGCLRGTPHRWLDLEALSHGLLRAGDQLIRYFTAVVGARPGDPQQPQRQQVYLRALVTLPCLSVRLGHYLTHAVRMPLAAPPPVGPQTVEVLKTEEKGSDVNLATYLLLDAFRKDCLTDRAGCSYVKAAATAGCLPVDVEDSAARIARKITLIR